MNASALFLAGAGTGLLAGGTSCAAVQLGLLTGAVRGIRRPVSGVGAFLLGKLATHTLLGALLGLAGAAVQPSPRARALLLTAAALVLLLFALDLLGLHLLPHHTSACRPPPRTAEPLCAPPAHTEPPHAPPARAESPHAIGPLHVAPARAEPPHTAGPLRAAVWRVRARGVGLGAVTVLVPCGLTLSAEVLAVTSRSVLGGAAVMGGFVLGTAPLFGLIGVAVGRALEVLRGRLTALVGVGLLAVACWTLLSGLRLGGWLPESAPAAGAAMNARFVRTGPDGVQIVTVWAVRDGYRPAVLQARAGPHTVLALRTDHNESCTRDLVIPGRNLERVLPASGTLTIDLGPVKPGRLRFTCALGHYFGQITFR